jgi:membrane protein YdbS with pleckstrin-like domain
MTQVDGRVIKPPVEQVVSGRVFHPDNAFLYKKWLRVGIIILAIWVIVWGFRTLMSIPDFATLMIDLFVLTELFVLLDWTVVFQMYWFIASVTFMLWTVYTYVYVKRIDYSLASWEGDVSPEIFVKKGIINITKKHVPFRTITHVKTTRGVFDRLFGIGTVQVETAAKSTTSQGGGLLALLLQRAMSGGAAEENIEGIKFHEELRDFILRELRGFGRVPLPSEGISARRNRKKVFTRETLDAFREIRDALVLQQQERD